MRKPYLAVAFFLGCATAKGEQGWELLGISATHQGSADKVFYGFKRPAP
jgi:hypothetical protein